MNYILAIALALSCAASSEAKETKKKKAAPEGLVIMGGIEQSVVVEYVERHNPQLRFCFQKEGGKSGLSSAKMSVRFMISSKGAVSGAGVTNPKPELSALSSCVVGVMSKIVFPKIKGGGVAEVDYPLSFPIAK